MLLHVCIFQVGAVVYSDVAWSAFDLDKYTDWASLLHSGVMKDLMYSGNNATTDLGVGLDGARDLCLNKGRPNFEKLIIFVTSEPHSGLLAQLLTDVNYMKVGECVITRFAILLNLAVAMFSIHVYGFK